MTKLGIKHLAKLACKRYIKKRADTFIVIYGLPRTGKTTLGFKILFNYLRLKRKLFREGKSKWNPENTWSKLFRKYFATSAEDASNKIKNNPDGSFTFVDEGLDVLSWHERLTKEQKDLLELLQKTGKKGQLTILITASFKILTKETLARAHYLFIIPDEPSETGNRALLFKNYTMPFLAESNPFGLNKLIRDLSKHPFIAEDKERVINYLLRQKRLVAVVHFQKMDDKLYDLYERLVKEPSIMRERRKRRMVSYAKYYKLKYMFDVLIYNLYVKDGKSIAQIERLLMDKFGTSLATRSLIQNHLNHLMALEVKPDLSEDVVLEKPITVSPEEDITLDSSLGTGEEIKRHPNTAD